MEAFIASLAIIFLAITWTCIKGYIVLAAYPVLVVAVDKNPVPQKLVPKSQCCTENCAPPGNMYKILYIEQV